MSEGAKRCGNCRWYEDGWCVWALKNKPKLPLTYQIVGRLPVNEWCDDDCDTFAPPKRAPKKRTR